MVCHCSFQAVCVCVFAIKNGAGERCRSPCPLCPLHCGSRLSLVCSFGGRQAICLPVSSAAPLFCLK